MTEYCLALVRIALDGMKMCDVELEKVVKQGSLLSAILFAITNDYAHRKLLAEWEEKGLGMQTWHHSVIDSYGLLDNIKHDL